MKKTVFLAKLFSLIMLIALLPAVSALLSFTSPTPLYNLGDEANISLSVSVSQTTNDFVSISLICEEKSIEIYKTPLKVSAGEQKNIVFSTSFDKTLTEGMTGPSCFYRASYGSESQESTRFEISSNIIINVANTFSLIDPSSSFNISGSATKKNGQPLNGYIFLTIPELSISATSTVSAGTFALNAVIPANAKSKDYTLIVEAFDKDSSQQILNTGNYSFSFKVRQVLTSLDLAIGSLTLTPGNNMTYTAFALDQADESMDSTVQVQISSPSAVLENKIISTSSAYSYATQSNSTPGKWIIKVNSSQINFEKSFMVEEYADISFTLMENSLIIKNIGNVPYSKEFSVKIADSTFTENVSIPVGGFIERRLNAPDGEYTISAIEDGELNELGTSFLTGRVIGVSDPTRLRLTQIVPWIWIILIIILGLAAILYYKKVSKKTYTSSTPSSNPVIKKVSSIVQVSPSKSSIMEYGQKQKCAVVSLKIKEFDNLKNKDVVKDTLLKILSSANNKKGYTEKSFSGYTFIFSPLITKQPENSTIAVEFAKEAAKTIEEHNKRFGSRIEFGLGVHEGELAVEYRGGIFNYTSTGNTIALARKTADTAQNSIVLTDASHSATRAKVKVERKGTGWRVLSISDNAKYGDFITKFKQRQSRQ